MCCSKNEDEELKFRTERSCTDVLMLLLFIGSWIASFVILGEVANSNVERVIYGVDFDGNICGKSPNYTHLPYAAWSYLPTTPERFRIKACIASCEETKTNTNVIAPSQLHESWAFFHYCLPLNTHIDSEFTSSTATASRVIADLYTTWPVIFCASFVAVIFSFLYVKLMKIACCRTIIVYSVVLFVVAGGFLLGWSLLKYAQESKSADVEVKDRALAAQITGWIVVGLTIIFILVVFFLRKRIALALEVTGAAASAINQMKSMVLFPIIPFFMVVAYMVYWIIVSLHLFAVKTVSEVSFPAGTDYTSIPYYQGKTKYFYAEWDTRYTKLFAYHFFQMLWSLQFLVYLTFLTLAGAVANWYFSKPDPADKERRLEGDEEGSLPNSPVCSSFFRAIRYHLGTVAFGALLIAIIRFIRAVLYYIQKKTEKQQNFAVKCMFCIVQCCLRCFQKCIDYVSRNALAWCAINGTNFCTSACASFGLLIANPARCVAMNMVGSFILFFGKICIALITTGTGGVIIMYAYKDEISSTIMPLVVIFIISFVVATLFMEVFETALDTMFLCVLADTNLTYAPPGLVQALGKAEQEADPEEMERQKKRSKDALGEQYKEDNGNVVSTGTAYTEKQ